jgi:uncharacterized protein (UPF0218 family)
VTDDRSDAEDSAVAGSDTEDSAVAGSDTEVLLELPGSARHAFKDPMGPVTTDADELLAAAGDPLVAVGDVVTFHLLEAGRPPDVAFVDERTERTAVDDEVASVVPPADVVVENPAATLTRELLAALVDAVGSGGPTVGSGDPTVGSGNPTVVRVEGEEDLATLPAVLAVPDGATVVYGQPGEGMVHVTVDADVRARVRDLFDLLEGDQEAALAVLDVA